MLDCGAGGPSGIQTGERAGTNASGAAGGGQLADDVRTEHDVRRRVEHNAAEPMGLRPFSTVSVMVANTRSLNLFVAENMTETKASHSKDGTKTDEITPSIVMKTETLSKALPYCSIPVLEKWKSM
jgi:hypothetical protein